MTKQVIAKFRPVFSLDDLKLVYSCVESAPNKSLELVRIESYLKLFLLKVDVGLMAPQYSSGPAVVKEISPKERYLAGLMTAEEERTYETGAF